MTPTNNMSVLTMFWVSLRASSWAFHTTLSARSLNCSNIIFIEDVAEPEAAAAGAAAVTEPAMEEPKNELLLEETPVLMLAPLPMNPAPGAPTTEAFVETVDLLPLLGIAALNSHATRAATAAAAAAATAFAALPMPPLDSSWLEVPTSASAMNCAESLARAPRAVDERSSSARVGFCATCGARKPRGLAAAKAEDDSSGAGAGWRKARNAAEAPKRVARPRRLKWRCCTPETPDATVTGAIAETGSVGRSFKN
mmetsp:Transcript_139487/g.353746  ORF Transcript_139487/g.353746 Transcript_139487/m.353746 type:complete len:254 (+) Transcript_139487:422-1183(+)